MGPPPKPGPEGREGGRGKGALGKASSCRGQTIPLAEPESGKAGPCREQTISPVEPEWDQDGKHIVLVVMDFI